MHNEAIFEINRDVNGRLGSVSVVMPTWDKEVEDGSIVVNLPFLGIKFYSFGGMNINSLAHDAVKGFCINSDKYGMGLEKELITIGWKETNSNTFTFGADKNFVFQQIVDTGDQQPQFIDFEPELV